MRRFIGRLYRDDSGATAIEYGLIAGLVFLAIITAVGAFTSKSVAMFEWFGDIISAAIS
ncbi:Flp family type IVb pilin [Brevundimonas sp.]|uniref:Flp family type IVb pilin n=1 Tax=Brevundimonas sp. TaxID=1871086 RepID=UPI002EDA10F9